MYFMKIKPTMKRDLVPDNSKCHSTIETISSHYHAIRLKKRRAGPHTLQKGGRRQVFHRKKQKRTSVMKCNISQQTECEPMNVMCGDLNTTDVCDN